MTITHIKNLDVITLDENSRVLENTDLVIEDNKIVSIGKASDDLVADEVIDGSNRIAMPGMVNSHCHAAMTLERGWAEDMVFPEWLPKIWQIENKLTADDIYWGTALAALEMIKTGTIAFNDMYFHMDKVLDVVVKSGMRAQLGATIFDPGEGTSVGDALQHAQSWTRQVNEMGHPRLRAILAPHAPYTVSEPLLRSTLEAAHQDGVGIHIHLSEDEEQVEQSIERYGMSPVKHLNSIGFFDAPKGVVGAHVLMANDEDLAILSDKNVKVANCPITYMKLAMPLLSLKRKRDAGVHVSLGSDGPASNSDMDMFAVMRQTGLLEKSICQDPTALSGDELLRMATQKGAETSGFAQSGALTEQGPADFILLDKNAPHLNPVHNLIANVTHSAKGSDVMDMMVEGQWVMRDRNVLTLDEEEILFEVKARAARLSSEAALG